MMYSDSLNSIMHISRWLVFTFLSAVLAGSLACERNPDINKQKFLESGNRFFEKGDFPAAIIQFSNALQIDPNFAAAHFKLGESYLKMQRLPDAYRELQRTVELDHSNSKASLDLGLMLIAGRSYDQVQPVAARMLENNPKSIEAHLLLSELYRVQAKFDLAIQEIREAIGLDPTQPQLYVQLGTLQSGTNNAGGAEISFKKALELDPHFLAAVQALAGLYQTLGRSLDAEREIRYGIELDPSRVELRKSLALLYYSQQRKPEAEQVMIQAKRDLARKGDNYRVLGEYYNNIGEVDKALAEFALISKEHPDDLRTKEDYIRLLLSHGRVEEARDLNDGIVKAYPRETGALVIRSTMLNADGKYDQAARILEGAVHDAPENAYGHYQYGIALNKTGSLERAKQEWFEAAKLAPQMSEVQLALAEVARQNADLRLLRQTAEQLIRNSPSDPRGYLLRAESEIKRKQASAAEQDLEKAVELAPQDGAVYTAMANFYRGQAKAKEAQRYYEQALDRDPQAIEPLAGIVSILAGEKQSAKALARVQAQVTKTPNNDAIYVFLAGLQVENKDLAGAQVSLQRAIGINRHNVDAAALLSKIEMARGERDQALATAYQAIADNPRATTACFSAGTLEELLGNTQKAEALYRKALELEPDYAPAANNLAYLMLENRRDADGALPLALMARKKMPDSSGAADTLAWVYYQKGLYGFAAGLLREALQRNPNNATYHYHLGMVCQKQNKKIEARKHLQRALQINPSYPAAEQIRSTLNQISS
jgi:tetratricopeptide (TPR) repeat protein